MLRFLKWAAITLAGLLLAFIAVALVFGAFRFGMMPMMARGFRGPFMYGGFRFMGWAFLLGRLLIPLAFVALLVFTGVAIGRGLRVPRTPVALASCKNCGRPVQSDWSTCPYCGASLKNDELVVNPGPGEKIA